MRRWRDCTSAGMADGGDTVAADLDGVGPVFWPFAYFDIYDYAIWGNGGPFWGYGYDDIYAGLFAPYGYDDLAGYFAAPRPHLSPAMQRPTGWRKCAATTAAISSACRLTAF